MLEVYSYLSPTNPISHQSSYDGDTPQDPCEEIDLLDSIQTENFEINCCFDNKTNQKLLSCSGENHYSFSDLIDCVPENTETVALAQALNYLINGIESQVIIDPPEFRKEYETLFCFDQTKTPNVIGGHSLQICHQEHYDTSKIEAPTIKDKALEFYIEIHHTPYKVTCGWPVKTDPPDIKQETLPPAEEDLFAYTQTS